jgi:UDP-N-acetylmuramoylalanine--D-glutamate ligase
MSTNPANSYAILGAARSGLAVARLLRREGALVFVSDRRDAATAGDAIARLEEMGIEYEFGEHNERVLESGTLVLSPGVPDSIPIVREAIARGLEVVSEIEIAARRCRGQIVAITGTNGKTTTTELTGFVFRGAGRRTFVAGNVGTAFSEIVADADESSVVVLEVSSFQLEHIRTFRPAVAVILNVTPDHLDRYPDFQAYVDAKFRITMSQQADDVLIYCPDSDPLMDAPLRTNATPLAITQHGIAPAGAFIQDGLLTIRRTAESLAESVIPVGEIRIRGPHNLYNAMAATLACASLGVSIDSIARGLRDFAGVPHRLEPIRELDGVRWVNDSKATNVDSVWYALSSFSEPVILIAGGRSKKASYDAILPLVRDRVKAAILVGEAADEMEAAFSGHTTIRRADYNLEEAVSIARSLSAPGDVVLLSPACASFDMFNNYEHRGDVFRSLVNGLEPLRRQM